ncbi:MAG: YitT family protein [Firmicutes bacterium]|nr:YitT family protein [Bacillota bacterium]MBQ6607405.1 YitT family protein [Bacillota bacterium]
MSNKNKYAKKYPLKKHIRNICLMTLGSLISVAGYSIFISANNLLAGGVWGIAGIINHFVPAVPVAVFIIALNLPLLLWGWNKINIRFALYTVFCVGLQSILLLFAPNVLPHYTNDPIMACIFGGLLIGAGSGLVVRYHGSGGGSEIIGIILKDKYDVSVGTIGLVINAFVVLLAGFIYGFEPAMYTMVELYVSSVAFGQVIEGLNRKRNMIIITEKGDELTHRLLFECGRGVTVIRGEGGFTHREKQVLLLVLSRFEMSAVKEIIADTDPTAFVCVNQTYEVLGRFVKKTHVNAALEAEQARLLREEDSISQEEQVRILEETGHDE